MMSDKIGPQHLRRKAILYVRQSSRHDGSAERVRLLADRDRRRGPGPVRGGRGLALHEEQPRLAAVGRDVPRGRHGADRPGHGLRAAPEQRPPSARAEGQRERVRARPATPALALGPLRESAARRARGWRAGRLRQGGRPVGEGPGPEGARGDQAGLRQGRGARQRATGAAVVPRARSQVAGAAAQRRHRVAQAELCHPVSDDRQPGLWRRLRLWQDGRRAGL